MSVLWETLNDKLEELYRALSEVEDYRTNAENEMYEAEKMCHRYKDIEEQLKTDIAEIEEALTEWDEKQ